MPAAGQSFALEGSTIMILNFGDPDSFPGEVSTTKFVAALGVTVLWTAVWSVSLLGLHTA